MLASPPLQKALSTFAFRLFARIERDAARLQGKGYGYDSVRKEVATALRLLARSPALVVDVGANVGDYTATIREHAPSCEIHLFEPAAKNAELLRERFASDRAVRVNQLAVADRAAEFVLFANEPGSTLGSLTQRRLDHFAMKMDHQETVRAVRFDDYRREHLDGREIDLLKLDIEGHELAALRGMEETLPRTRCLQFEFGGPNIDTRTYFQDFFYFFAEREFDLYRVTPLGPQPIPVYGEVDEIFWTANSVARNRRLK